jgi:hypothetical protein
MDPPVYNRAAWKPERQNPGLGSTRIVGQGPCGENIQMQGRSLAGVRRNCPIAWLAAVLAATWMSGCGVSSNPAEACKSLTEINFPGDPQVATLLGAAGYHDCLTGYETDPEKADSLRRQGQVEALKGSMLAVLQSPDAQSLRTRVIATSDLNTLLGFLYVLKASGRFSEAKVNKLDETFPHLQIGEAFRKYGQLPSPQ